MEKRTLLSILDAMLRHPEPRWRGREDERDLAIRMSDEIFFTHFNLLTKKEVNTSYKAYIYMH